MKPDTDSDFEDTIIITTDDRLTTSIVHRAPGHENSSTATNSQTVVATDDPISVVTDDPTFNKTSSSNTGDKQKIKKNNSKKHMLIDSSDDATITPSEHTQKKQRMATQRSRATAIELSSDDEIIIPSKKLGQKKRRKLKKVSTPPSSPYLENTAKSTLTPTQDIVEENNEQSWSDCEETVITTISNGPSSTINALSLSKQNEQFLEQHAKMLLDSQAAETSPAEVVPRDKSNITEVPSDDTILSGDPYENLEEYLNKIQFSERYKHVGKHLHTLIELGKNFSLNRPLQLLRIIALFDAAMHYPHGISAILDMATGTGKTNTFLLSMILFLGRKKTIKSSTLNIINPLLKGLPKGLIIAPTTLLVNEIANRYKSIIGQYEKVLDVQLGKICTLPEHNAAHLIPDDAQILITCSNTLSRLAEEKCSKQKCVEEWMSATENFIIFDEAHQTYTQDSASYLRERFSGNIQLLASASARFKSGKFQSTLQDKVIEYSFNLPPLTLSDAVKCGALCPVLLTHVLMPVLSKDKNPSADAEFGEKANLVLQKDQYIHSVVDLIATGKNKNQQPFFGQKTLIICSSIQQAEALCSALNQCFKENRWAKHPLFPQKSPTHYAKTYHSDNKESANNMRQFKQNQLQIMIGVKSVIEGLDVADISLVINFSPSKLMHVELQKLGRVMRKTNNKPYGNYVTIQMFSKQVMIDQLSDFKQTISIGDVDYPYSEEFVPVSTPQNSPKLKYTISHQVFKQQTAVEILKSNTELDQAYLSDICNQGLQEIHQTLTAKLVKSNPSNIKNTQDSRLPSKSKSVQKKNTSDSDIDSINHSLDSIIRLLKNSLQNNLPSNVTHPQKNPIAKIMSKIHVIHRALEIPVEAYESSTTISEKALMDQIKKSITAIYETIHDDHHMKQQSHKGHNPKLSDRITPISITSATDPAFDIQEYLTLDHLVHKIMPVLSIRFPTDHRINSKGLLFRPANNILNFERNGRYTRKGFALFQPQKTAQEIKNLRNRFLTLEEVTEKIVDEKLPEIINKMVLEAYEKRALTTMEQLGLVIFAVLINTKQYEEAKKLLEDNRFYDWADFDDQLIHSDPEGLKLLKPWLKRREQAELPIQNNFVTNPFIQKCEYGFTHALRLQNTAKVFLNPGIYDFVQSAAFVQKLNHVMEQKALSPIFLELLQSPSNSANPTQSPCIALILKLQQYHLQNNHYHYAICWIFSKLSQNGINFVVNTLVNVLDGEQLANLLIHLKCVTFSISLWHDSKFLSALTQKHSLFPPTLASLNIKKRELLTHIYNNTDSTIIFTGLNEIMSRIYQTDRKAAEQILKLLSIAPTLMVPTSHFLMRNEDETYSIKESIKNLPSTDTLLQNVVSDAKKMEQSLMQTRLVFKLKPNIHLVHLIVASKEYFYGKAIRDFIYWAFAKCSRDGMQWLIYKLICEESLTGPMIAHILGNTMVDQVKKYQEDSLQLPCLIWALTSNSEKSLDCIDGQHIPTIITTKNSEHNKETKRKITTLKSSLASFNSKEGMTIFDILAGDYCNNRATKFLFRILLPYVNPAEWTEARARKIIELNNKYYNINYCNIWLNQLSKQPQNSSSHTDIQHPIAQTHTNPISAASAQNTLLPLLPHPLSSSTPPVFVSVPSSNVLPQQSIAQTHTNPISAASAQNTLLPLLPHPLSSSTPPVFVGAPSSNVLPQQPIAQTHTNPISAASAQNTLLPLLPHPLSSSTPPVFVSVPSSNVLPQQSIAQGSTNLVDAASAQNALLLSPQLPILDSQEIEQEFEHLNAVSAFVNDIESFSSNTQEVRHRQSNNAFHKRRVAMMTDEVHDNTSKYINK